MRSLTPAGKVFFTYLAILIVLALFASSAWATNPKPPKGPETVLTQDQGQAQGQHQGQAQGQAQGQQQTSTGGNAVNDGVTASADGSTSVNTSVSTDIPSVTLGLGAGSSSSAYFANNCVVPAEGGLLKRPHNILGIWSVGQKQVVHERCMEVMLDLQEREMALREHSAGINREKTTVVAPIPIPYERELTDCESNLAGKTESLERCEEKAYGGKSN